MAPKRCSRLTWDNPTKDRAAVSPTRRTPARSRTVDPTDESSNQLLDQKRSSRLMWEKTTKKASSSAPSQLRKLESTSSCRRRIPLSCEEKLVVSHIMTPSDEFHFY
uniref:Uncharacterized protein n=1 Tax=Setaria italica TaxID=4555 RepID=K3Y079_SETIT